MTREAQKQRSMTGITKRTYNNFSVLENEVECSICNNFGHEDSECRSRFQQRKEQASSTKTWRIKEPQTERCGIAFYAEGQENLWYIDSGCSKHMTGDKEKLESYSALEKGKKVSFGNDTPATIKGKGIAQLKEKVKAGNVLYVDGLKHNLLSVSQMCDQRTEVIFRSNGCLVRDLDTGKTVIKGKRTPNNLYIFEEGQQQCYLSKDDEHWLWHRRLGHISFSQIRKACKYQAVRDLPDIKIPDNTICKSCQFGKQTRTNFPEKEGSASMPLELVHTDTCGPFSKRTPRGEEYLILFIDDFSRFVWLGLMKHKDEAFEKFKSFKALVENESGHKIKCLRSDRGGEFTSNEFFDFCEEHGIRREFSTARTPQQNGVVERMNRTVQQMARAMLDESGTPATFWGEAAHAAVVILNKTNVRVNSTQTPHELWNGKTPSVKHFKIFGSKCYIKNTDEQLGKLEPRADEGILLGYSPHSKAYKCYNKRLGRIIESIDVVVDEKGYIPRQVHHEDIEEDEGYPQQQNDEEPQEEPEEES
jgi:transposase InsO family protein